MTQPFLPPFVTTMDMTPINQVALVTPSDTIDLPGGYTRAFFAGVAGSITAQDTNGNSFVIQITSTNVGTLIWIRAKRILATGTTATGIYACY